MNSIETILADGISTSIAFMGIDAKERAKRVANIALGTGAISSEDDISTGLDRFCLKVSPEVRKHLDAEVGCALKVRDQKARELLTHGNGLTLAEVLSLAAEAGFVRVEVCYGMMDGVTLTGFVCPYGFSLSGGHGFMQTGNLEGGALWLRKTRLIGRKGRYGEVLLVVVNNEQYLPTLVRYAVKEEAVVTNPDDGTSRRDIILSVHEKSIDCCSPSRWDAGKYGVVTFAEYLNSRGLTKHECDTGFLIYMEGDDRPIGYGRRRDESKAYDYTTFVNDIDDVTTFVRPDTKVVPFRYVCPHPIVVGRDGKEVDLSFVHVIVVMKS